MYIPNDSLSDTRLRYGGCLIRAGEQIIYIRDILRCTSTTVSFIGNLWKNFGYEKRKEYSFNLKDIDYSKVSPQYVNFSPSKGCGLIRRVARRSTYSLGTKSNNTVVFPLGDKQIRVELLPYALTRVGKKYPSKEVAYQQIHRGLSPARAISKRVALVKKEDKILVCLLNKPVGVVLDKDTVEVIYKHKYFKEELEELNYIINLTEG